MTTLDTNAQSIDVDFLETEPEIDSDVQIQDIVIENDDKDLAVLQSQNLDEYKEFTFTYKFTIEDFSFLNHTDLPAKKYLPIKVSDLPKDHHYIPFAKSIGLSDDKMVALAQLKQSDIAGSLYSTVSNIYAPQIQRSLDDGELMLGDLRLRDLMKIEGISINPYFSASQERSVGSGTVLLPSLNVSFTVPLVVHRDKIIYNMIFHSTVKVNPEHDDLEGSLQQLSLKLSRKQYPSDLSSVDYAVDLPRTFSQLKPSVYYIRECVITDAKTKEGKPFKAVKCKCHDPVNNTFFDLALAGGASTMIKTSTSLFEESHGVGLLLDFKGFDSRGSVSHVLVIPKPLYSKFSNAIPKEYLTVSDTNPFSDDSVDSLPGSEWFSNLPLQN